MKLWQKISCISIVVLLIIIGVCSAALLVYARNAMIGMATQQGIDKHNNLVSAFSNMTMYYTGDGMNHVTRESVVKYCFSTFADETSVLVVDGNTVYSQLSIDPAEYIAAPDVGEERYTITEVNGRKLFMQASLIVNREEHYLVYTVADISDIYQSINRMGWVFAAISAVCVGAGVMLITLLVRRGMRPLTLLSASAKRIAGGEYEERAEAPTKDEVGELALDFNRMADAVQARIAELTDTAERRQMFIAGLTHEFKTPMTSVLIHSDTLLNAHMSDAERERSLYHIHEQIRWLERLTQKLLKLVSLDEGIETEPVSSSALAEAVKESVADMLELRGTPLILEADGTLLNIDFDLMRSAVANLVDNASKASDTGESIALTIKNGVITVRDNGRGIPPDELQHICEPFYMADRSRSKKQGGSGLGLALVKRIADAHGAELTFKSEAGAGTVATITFC